MKNNDRIFIAKNSMEIYESLNMAIQEASGSGHTPESLSKISALELLDEISTNNIRFIFNPKNKRRKKHEH